MIFIRAFFFISQGYLTHSSEIQNDRCFKYIFGYPTFKVKKQYYNTGVWG